MKNIFLTFILLMTVSFAFAKNITQNKLSNLHMNSLVSNAINPDRLTGSLVGTCSFTVYVYNNSGRYLGSKTITFENVATERDCYDMVKFYKFANGIR